MEKSEVKKSSRCAKLLIGIIKKNNKELIDKIIDQVFEIAHSTVTNSNVLQVEVPVLELFPGLIDSDSDIDWNTVNIVMRFVKKYYRRGKIDVTLVRDSSTRCSRVVINWEDGFNER